MSGFDQALVSDSRSAPQKEVKDGGVLLIDQITGSPLSEVLPKIPRELLEIKDSEAWIGKFLQLPEYNEGLEYLKDRRGIEDFYLKDKEREKLSSIAQDSGNYYEEEMEMSSCEIGGVEYLRVLTNGGRDIVFKPTSSEDADTPRFKISSSSERFQPEGELSTITSFSIFKQGDLGDQIKIQTEERYDNSDRSLLFKVNQIEIPINRIDFNDPILNNLSTVLVRLKESYYRQFPVISLYCTNRGRDRYHVSEYCGIGEITEDNKKKLVVANSHNGNVNKDPNFNPTEETYFIADQLAILLGERLAGVPLVDNTTEYFSDAFNNIQL